MADPVHSEERAGRKPGHSPLLEEMENALLAVDRVKAGRLVKESCKNSSPFTCLETLVVPALEEVGRRWEQGDVALSQVYMSGRICEEIVDTMLPQGDSRRVDQPKMAIAVLEDHHTLGKRIVLSVLRAGGYELADYGHGITADELVRRVTGDRVRILLISTLMLPAALHAKEAIAQIKKDLPGTKVIVGGAPFNFDPQLWKEIGADAFGRTASDTLHLVQQMATEVN